MSNKPIGIFDSGIGGLTVVKAISEILPKEDLMYFGDTAHLPYGDKSKDSVKLYSKRISDFLIGSGCKLIVIACNTASAHAHTEITKRHPNTPIINVIDPTVSYCAEKYDSGKIGIIATKGTIKSRIYPRKIKKENASLVVSQQATPLLAPMIEEGFFNNNISRAIINSYLSANNLKGMKALILACTHYPLIKPEVEEFLQKVEVIDSATVVAREIKTKLKELKLLSKTAESSKQFFVSDFTKAFEETSKIFFGEKIELIENRIWD
ncbi:glutamate racemase [Crocinitomix catalasitica]|nr:glutamate racemase [Crocinitomix catalasitica]